MATDPNKAVPLRKRKVRATEVDRAERSGDLLDRTLQGGEPQGGL